MACAVIADMSRRGASPTQTSATGGRRLGTPDPGGRLAPTVREDVAGGWIDGVTVLKRGVKQSSASKTQSGDPEQQNGRRRPVECAVVH